MTHATDGLLQAYLDGEIDGTAAAVLRDHLGGCTACAAELETLRQAGRQAHEALAVLIAPEPPMSRARAALAAERRASRSGVRRLGARSLAKAAMLLLTLAGAGAAAIPGSPVRRALEASIARVAELIRGPESPVASPAEPMADDPAALAATGASVAPANGRVRVVLHAPAQGTDVVVRLVDAPRAEVETATLEAGVRFRTGAGRIEVSSLSPGTVTIVIPRSVQNATVEIDGRVYAYKRDGVLQLSGPAGEQSGTEVSFRIGT
jgi:anti-sigma factor RsiW